MNSTIIVIACVVTGLLFLLNSGFAYIFRRRQKREMLTYMLIALVELGAFSITLALSLRLIHVVPFHLPPGLPVNRAEIGATLAVALGLFPVAYWHRTSASEIRAKMAEDAKVIKDQNGGVRLRSNEPGEWMN